MRRRKRLLLPSLLTQSVTCSSAPRPKENKRFRATLISMSGSSRGSAAISIEPPMRHQAPPLYGAASPVLPTLSKARASQKHRQRRRMLNCKINGAVTFEIAKWSAFYHHKRLRNHPARLKLVLSENTHALSRPESTRRNLLLGHPGKTSGHIHSAAYMNCLAGCETGSRETQ